MDTYVVIFGCKEVLLTRQPDGFWMAKCACSALDACVHVPLTERAVRLLTRPQTESYRLEDILPNTDLQVREIFITGMTPAEFDWTFRHGFQSREAYEKLGYVF